MTTPTLTRPAKPLGKGPIAVMQLLSQTVGRFRGATLGFIMGAASAGFLILIILENLSEHQRNSPAESQAVALTPADAQPQRASDKEDERELTKEQLASYIQWAQQMNAQNSGAGPNSMGLTHMYPGMASLPGSPSIPSVFGRLP